MTGQNSSTRPPRGSGVAPPLEPPEARTEEQSWLKADYVGHVFHYRMPETVAIASVNPVVPSPLTVKLALVASLLRDGRIGDAELLAPGLPDLEVRISPPASSIIFRALLRYVRPPAEGGQPRIDANTGGAYGTNPHNREFALWGGQPATPGDLGPSGVLTVFLRAPQSLASVIEDALWHIGYLGAKDSLVTCVGVERQGPDPGVCCAPVREDGIPDLGFGNFVVRLADFARDAPPVELRQLIPTQRIRRHYIPNSENAGLFVLPGEMTSYGRVKFYRKGDQQ